MKRTIFGVVAVAAIALVPAVSQAQRANRAPAAKAYTFSVGAGLSIPTGDVSDATKTGFNVQGAVNHKLGMSPMWMRGEVAFHRFGSQDLGGADGHLSELGAIANLGYSFPTTSKVRPYVLGGLGLYSQKYTIEAQGASLSQSESDIGFNGGVGIAFPMAGRSASVEARYHSVNGGDKMGNQSSTFVPVTFSLNF
jgi:opacity protein-like surface antigen